MRNVKRLNLLLVILVAVFTAGAQPGKIIRATSLSTTLHTYFTPTTVSSQEVLDPNKDGYVSATTSGFPVSDDVTSSEINYKPIMPYSVEPYGDLRRGPSHLYSDFVPGIDNASYYMYYRSTVGSEALQFRMRLGTIIPGAKGFSILLDTDGKFGTGGPNADPNYVAATTGTNGNPGFEVEIDLFTQTTSQTGIAVYNVDGTSSPGTAVWSATNWQDYSQIALASTSDNGDPDFFLDFFVPFTKLSSLGITASTPLRAIATTVMAPQPAIGGPKSDIYGLSDAAYSDPNAEYEAFINAQPSFTPANLAVSGTASPTTTMCTAAPQITSTALLAGTVTVQGSWTKNNITTAGGTADIWVYRNGTKVGVVTGVNSGYPWSLPGVVVAAGDLLTAQAIVSGEKACQSSNTVTVKSCSVTTSTSGLNFTCGNSRGMSGTRGSSTQVVKLYTFTASGPVLFATDNAATSPSTFTITYSGTTWGYNGIDNMGQADPCSGGRNDIPDGSYFFTVTEAGQCESGAVVALSPTIASGQGACIGTSVSATASPTIAQSGLSPASSGLSGTTVSGATVMLYQNGAYVKTATASGTAYSFTGLSLAQGDVLTVYAFSSTSGCISTPASITVSTCVTTAPIINTNASGGLRIGQYITGTSREAAGTTIKVYNASNALLATTTVQTNGSWTTSGATYSNGFTGTTAANTGYYATATVGSCTAGTSATVSTGSAITPANRCGTITANVPAGKITSSTTSVSVAYSGATNLKVTLYEDDQPVISQSGLSSTSANPLVLDVAGKLYAGNGTNTGILTVGVQEAGQEELICPTTYLVNASCTAPAAPSVSPAGTQTISPGQSITYTIMTPTAGLFYSISDQSTGGELASGVWASASADFNMITKPVSSATTAVVKAVAMSSSGEVCTNTTTRTVSVLPVTLILFKGIRSGGENLLQWQTATEEDAEHFDVERSSEGGTFSKVGALPVRGGGTFYQYSDKVEAAGTYYYRLKMVDRDGRFSYSRVVTLRVAAAGVVLSGVYPNPFASGLNFTLQLPARQSVQVDLVDGLGRSRYAQLLEVPQGAHVISLPHLERLEAGVYLLTVRTGDQCLLRKVLKVSLQP